MAKAMSSLPAEDVRRAALQASLPLVLRGFVREWKLCSRSLDDWNEDFGDKKVPWRVGQRSWLSDEPCWERACGRRDLTFRQFLEVPESSTQWMYFDYKHLPEWFSSDGELFKSVSWAKFGFPEKGAAESTLWVGSGGAHTPAHQDTYGCNIVAQLYGKKRWILFPPETGGLRPTRVPYEESSIYSELNFVCPRDLEPFNGLSGCRCVELEAGDALLVPRGWWHHVLHTSPVAIALNTWLPHEQDVSARVSEALVKVLVAQLCKDLPRDTSTLLLNPNEDDLPETPLAVLFLQLDAVTTAHRDQRRKLRRAKRQKTRDDSDHSHSGSDLPPPSGSDFPSPSDNNLPPPSGSNHAPPADTADPPDPGPLHAMLQHEHVAVASGLTGAQLVEMLQSERRRAGGAAEAEQVGEDDTDGCTSKLRLTKAVINAYSQSNVIELVKQNLLNVLS